MLPVSLGGVGFRRHRFRTRRHGFDAALGLDRLALDLVAGMFAGAAALRTASGAVIGFDVGGALGAFLFVDQRLPVGDRDLIVVGMDFAEGEEAVAIAAVIDEGGLQRRLYARNLGKIDVAAELLTVGGFEVEFFHAVAAQNNHPGLLGVGRIDEHFVGH